MGHPNTKREAGATQCPTLGFMERGERYPVLGNNRSAGFADALLAILPLPEGEGRGEGEETVEDQRCTKTEMLPAHL